MRRSLLVAGIILTSAVVAFAATTIGASGTTQMAGEWATFNKPYGLGDKGNKMNFTLVSAEYRVDQVIVENDFFVPGEDEKLLVLHYTVHNPEPKEQQSLWNTFKFTAVDSDDQNHEYLNTVGIENNKKKMSMNLKPAQKVEAYTIIKVGANGEVPKLIVKRGNGPVLRYDLRGKVKALPAAVADPADKTGATALMEIKGIPGTYYTATEFDFKYDKIEVRNDAVDNLKPKKNGALAVAYITVKNKAPKERTIVWSTIKPELDTDSGSGEWASGVHEAKSLAYESNIKLKSGEELQIAYVFFVKAGAKPESIEFKTREGRTVSFDTTSAN